MGTTIRRQNNKKGIAIFMVLFIMVVLGALMVQFHQSSRQAQNKVHRFQTSEMARQLASAGQEEAFDYLYKETGEVYDASFKPREIPEKIIKKDPTIDMSSSGPEGRKSVKGIPLKIPATEALAGDIMEVTATARIADSRNTDYDGNRYYGNEVVGTIEIVVTAKAKDKYKKQFPGACTIVRHHDYKVASIVTKKSERSSSYSGADYLDYVLFVRNGQQEFLSPTIGSSLNPKDVSLEINAQDNASLGLVNFGASGNFYHYLNISNSNKSLLPGADAENNLFVAEDSDVDKFFPAFREEVGKKLKEAVKKEGAKLKSWDVKGHKAKFFQIKKPITDDAMSNEYLKDARFVSTLNATQKQNKNLPPATDDLHYYDSIKINPVEKLKDILESDVRKLYLNYAYFIMDLSNCRVTGEAKKGFSSEPFDESIGDKLKSSDVEKLNKTRTACYKMEHLTNGSSITGQLNMQQLNNFINGHGDDSAAYTYINDEFAYASGEASHGSNDKLFYKPSNSDSPSGESNPEQAHYPYSHFNLWNKRDMTADELEEFGIYDKAANKLHLRGIVHCRTAITLGNPSTPLEVDGCGVIIANGIYIEGSIVKKNKQDVCVLFARDGIIKVKTDKLIEAALIAMGRSNKTSSVTSNEALNLKGSIATDFLFLNQWKNGVTHKITYDSALDGGKREDIYQINISKWVTFERVLENE